MCGSMYSYILVIRHYVSNTFSALLNLRNRWILANILCESQFSRLLINLCENARERWRIFGVRLFSLILRELVYVQFHLVERVVGVGQTPCTPGLLWGADQQWWRHRYGRQRGRRMPHVLVPYATRYGPSWIFPGVWPRVQVREKEAMFGLLNIYLCEKLFYKNRTENVATDWLWFINRERRFLRQDLSRWWLCESCWGKKLSTSIWTRLWIYLAYLDVDESSGTNESQTARSKFSFKKGRREKKRKIYIFSQVAQVARGAREREKEEKIY